MSKDYHDQLENNDESKEPSYDYWVWEEFGKLGSGKETISYYPWFRGDRSDIVKIRQQINEIRNILSMSKIASNNYLYLAGVAAVSKELEGQSPELDALAALRADKQEALYKQALRKELQEMYTLIDGVDYTQERFNKTASGLGFDPLEFENTFSVELPKSEVLKRWFFNNVTEAQDISDIKKALENGGIVSNEKDWSLTKNVASKLNMSGKVRGKWCQPSE